MIEDFDDIIFDHELTLLKLTESNLLCLYKEYELEIRADRLYIKSLSMDRLHLQVENLHLFQINRKDTD